MWNVSVFLDYLKYFAKYLDHILKICEKKGKITKTDRRSAVATFRLTTGHDCLARHLNRLQILPSVANSADFRLILADLNSLKPENILDSRQPKIWQISCI